MKDKTNLIVHCVIIALIVIVFVVAGLKLYNWHKGTVSDFDPDADTTGQYDTESEDFIIPNTLTESETAADDGWVDDGVTTVVCLGDSFFGNFQGADGIPSVVSELTGATVYNCGFGNMCMANKNHEFSEDYYDDAFSMYWLTYAICNQNFTLQENTINGVKEKLDYFDNTLATLKGIDFNTVDVIAVMYGANDYTQGRVIESAADVNDITTFGGSLRTSATMLQEAYPHARIIVMSPTYCYFPDGSGAKTGCDVKDFGYGTLPEYVIAEKNAAVDSNISFIDNYFGSEIGEDTIDQYLQDFIHPNAEGRKLLAAKLADAITKFDDVETDTE